MVDEGRRVVLRVTPVDLEGPHPGGIIDRRVLVEPNRMAVLAPRRQVLPVALHVVAGDLFLVPMRVHGAPPDAIREPVHAMALEGAVHPGVADPGCRGTAPGTRQSGSVRGDRSAGDGGSGRRSRGRGLR